MLVKNKSYVIYSTAPSNVVSGQIWGKRILTWNKRFVLNCCKNGVFTPKIFIIEDFLLSMNFRGHFFWRPKRLNAIIFFVDATLYIKHSVNNFALFWWKKEVSKSNITNALWGLMFLLVWSQLALHSLALLLKNQSVILSM